MKKITLLLAGLLLSAATSFAQSGQTGTLTWTLTNGTLTISGTGAMPNYSSTYAPWRSYRSSIETVIIEDGVTSIGNNAFDNCSLTSITIGNTVKSIGFKAFSICSSLTSVTIPNGVESIGQSAFYGCVTLASIAIGNSVTNIGESAFEMCYDLIEVTIPNRVTSIGNYAFYSCSSLTAITVAEDNTAYSSENGVLFNKTKTTLIHYPAAKSDVSYVIPNSVESIENAAFRNCPGLTSITIPNSVESLGHSAFYDCANLASITVGNSVKSIGNAAFGKCPGLTSVTIPNSVTSIGSSAFSGCGKLASLTLPLNAIGGPILGYIFNVGSSSTPSGYIYQETVDGISYYVPSSLNTINITDSATIKNSFFKKTNLRTVSMPYVKSIGESAFSYCGSLTSVTIGNSATSIGVSAFASCTSLTSITIPSGVTSIGDQTFYNCGRLTKIIIPESVTSIGNKAFYYCSALTSVTNCSALTVIGHEAFYNCSKLSSIVIPEGVTNIGTSAFADCPLTLTHLYIPNATVGSGAFNANNQLDSLTIGNPTAALSSIFKSVSQLKYVNIADKTIQSLPNAAFAGCSSLQELALPFIGASPTAPATLSALGANKTTLKKLTVGIAVPTSIQLVEEALKDYAYLEELTLGSAVAGVKQDALKGCNSLKDIYVHAAAAPTAYQGISEEVYALCVLHVPASRRDHYSGRTGWKEFLACGGIQEEAPLVVTTIPVPLRGGVVQGAGQFNYDNEAALEAAGNWGYEFKCWMEGASVVSRDNPYRFTVSAPRTLLAVFMPRENENTVTVAPQPASATISWETVDGATVYELILYSDANRTQSLDTIRLDGNGNVLRSATQTLSCNVGGLAPATAYYYLLTSYDSGNQALTLSAGDFATTVSAGIGGAATERGIRIYPNPVKHELFIQPAQPAENVSIFNFSGEQMLNSQWLNGQSIDVSHLPAGVYIVRTGGYTGKFVKE